MFERFTPGARAAVVHAQQHARRLGHNFIGGEHILLSVVSAGQPASAVLGAHGITPEYVETEIVRRIGLGRGAGSGGVPLGGLDREALPMRPRPRCTPRSWTVTGRPADSARAGPARARPARVGLDCRAWPPRIRGR
jgi:hypothetical protein